MAAGSRTGRTIPTEGLVLCLDALDQNSYPFSGSRWLNLAQDKYHVTFMGPGPSHGGYVVTDGTGSGYFNTDNNIYGDFDDISANDRMLGPDEAHPGSFTINTWVNHRSFSSYKEYISWWQNGGNAYGDGFLGTLHNNVRFGDDHQQALSATYAVTGAVDYSNLTNNVGLGTWYNITAVNEESSSAKVYMNGDLASQRDDEAGLEFGLNNGPDLWRHPDYSEYHQGAMGLLHIYDRALTATEVKQSFEMFRGRFSI